MNRSKSVPQNHERQRGDVSDKIDIDDLDWAVGGRAGEGESARGFSSFLGYPFLPDEEASGEQHYNSDFVQQQQNKNISTSNKKSMLK